MPQFPSETHADFRSRAGDRWRILGTTREIKVYLPLLDAARFTPATGVQPDETLGDDGLPQPRGVVLLDNLARDDAPDADYVQRFAQLAETLPPHVALRHPAFIAGLTGVPDTGRWAVTGYPGSGNIVLQAVLEQLDLRRPPRPPLRIACETAAWGEHQGHFMHRVIETLLADMELSTEHQAEDFVIAPGNLGSCSIRITLVGGGSMFINYLPHAAFIGNNFGAHIRWCEPAVRFFDHFGFRRIYLAVRNPIAVLASNAAKTARPLESALHDPAWFRSATRELSGYIEAALTCPDAYRTVRYEDLTNQPRETIQQLARDADFEISDADADAIWDRVGFKSLTPAGKEHLFNPRADKRPHFRAAHLDMMDDAGLDPAFTAFGYERPTADQLPPGDLQEPPPVEQTPSALYRRVDTRDLCEVIDEDLPLWVRADKPGLAEWVIDRFQNDWHRRLLYALGNGYGNLSLRGGRPRPDASAQAPTTP